MSDSTPKPNRSAATDGRRWWLASLLFHAVLIGWVVFFSPVRLVNPAEKPKVRASASEAKRVVADIEKRQLPSLQESLRKLAGFREQMVALENKKLSAYGGFARELRAGAPEKLAALQQRILSAQTETLATLDGAGVNVTNYIQTRAAAYYDDLAEGAKSAADRQQKIQQLQDQSEALLGLGGESFAAALSAQTDAAAAQERAGKALAAAEDARWPARTSRKRTARENQIEHYTYHVWRTREIVTNEPATLLKLQKDADLATQVLAWARTNAANAATNALVKNTDAARAAAVKAEKFLTSAEKKLVSAQKKLVDEPKTFAKAQRDLADLQQNLERWLAAPEPVPVALTPEDKIFLELQAAARDAQFVALQAQQMATQKISALPSDTMATMVNAAAVLDKLSPEEPAPAAELSGADVAQLYDAAVKTEASLVQSYRRLRATHLAMMQKLSLAKALDLTEATKPGRTNLIPVLSAPVNSGEEAVAAREALSQAKAEVGAMVQFAGSLITQAQNLDHAEAGTPVTFAQIDRQSELDAEIAQLANEDSGGWAQDLTGAMKKGKPGSQGNGGKPDGASGNSSNGNAGDVGSESNSGPDLGITGTDSPFHGPGGFGNAPIAGARGEAGRPEKISDTVQPLPGRRVSARGASAPFIFVDSWYIIGPFDNTARRNLQKKFPPEQIVDLNATYPGKDGLPIKWEFKQSGTPNVWPQFRAYNAARRDAALTPQENFGRNAEYCIYYAYTELFFEKECDLWLATGQDDFGKLWIEDALVWESGKNLKAWAINEGVRKVHFKAGINRMLCRVENGNSITEFSMVLSLMP